MKFLITSSSKTIKTYQEKDLSEKDVSYFFPYALHSLFAFILLPYSSLSVTFGIPLLLSPTIVFFIEAKNVIASFCRSIKLMELACTNAYIGAIEEGKSEVHRKPHFMSLVFTFSLLPAWVNLRSRLSAFFFVFFSAHILRFHSVWARSWTDWGSGLRGGESASGSRISATFTRRQTQGISLPFHHIKTYFVLGLGPLVGSVSSVNIWFTSS